MSGGVSEAVKQGLPHWKRTHQSIWISWRYQLIFPICMWIITIIEVSRCVIGFVDSDFDLLSELLRVLQSINPRVTVYEISF